MVTPILPEVVVDTAYEGDHGRPRTPNCGRAGNATNRGADNSECNLAFTQGVAQREWIPRKSLVFMVYPGSRYFACTWYTHLREWPAS